ncbi:MAG: EF-P lysine aminoacylase GenX [Cellvibrionaceae bacterium]
MPWQPAASLKNLRRRNEIISTIREYFASHFVMEVDVPVLASTAATDVHLDSIKADCCGATNFLQTSPEFFMKRLLAAHGEAIYYLGKAFRNEERGRRHNPEFTMLEWYRPGWDQQQLIREASELISRVLNLHCKLRGEPKIAAHNLPRQLSYQKLFQQRYGVNPHIAQVEELQGIAKNEFGIDWNDDDKNTWLDLLFSYGVEASLQDVTIVYDFPASQAALSKIENDGNGVPVAKRFEIFYRGVELANGYCELTDAKVQRERFQKDITQRQQQDLFALEMDENLLQAMKSGLPECSGIALGVDRLVMLALGAESLDEVIAFPFDRV